MDLLEVGASHSSVRNALALLRGTAADRERLLLVEGIWAHQVLLDTGVVVDVFFDCPQAAYSADARSIAERIAERAQASYRVSAKTLARLTERDRPDGLLSIVEMPTWSAADLPLRPDALVAVADGLETPGNLGTLLRTLDGCAADALLVTNQRARLSHPVVFRASHGTSLSLPQLVFADTADAVRWLTQRRFRVYLADTAAPAHYRGVDYGGRTAVVLGAERFGISAPWYAHDFSPVAIPMLGRGDSLNAAVSASVLLYEARARKNGWDRASSAGQHGQEPRARRDEPAEKLEGD